MTTRPRSMITETPMFIIQNCPPPNNMDENIRLHGLKDYEGLILGNMAGVVKLVRSKHPSFSIIGLDDAFQVGFEALIRCVRGWDPEDGGLYSYMATAVCRSLWHDINDLRQPIRIPRRIFKLMHTVSNAYIHLALTDKLPTLENIHAYCLEQHTEKKQITKQAVRNAIIMLSTRVTSGDDPVAGDDDSSMTVMDTIVDQRDINEVALMARDSSLAYSFMTAMQAKAVRLRNEGWGWTELGQLEGKSPQAVEYLYKAGINNARKGLGL